MERSELVAIFVICRLRTTNDKCLSTCAQLVQIGSNRDKICKTHLSKSNDCFIWLFSHLQSHHIGKTHIVGTMQTISVFKFSPRPKQSASTWLGIILVRALFSPFIRTGWCTISLKTYLFSLWISFCNSVYQHWLWQSLWSTYLGAIHK